MTTMGVKIFDAVKDVAAWNDILGLLPASLNDIYFRPEYCRLPTESSDSKTLLFVYFSDSNVWLHPFLLRPIPSIDGLDFGRQLFDIETAYGYGGPLSSTDETGFVHDAHEAFYQWLTQKQVIAEFVRFHPLLQNQKWAPSGTEIIYDRETVSLDLSSIHDGEMPFDSKTKNMIRKSSNLGVHIVEGRPVEVVKEFITLYNKTMTRVGAEQYYLFGSGYFQQLAELSEQTGMLLIAEYSGKWIGASFFLKGTTMLHYHLSATDPDARIPGITNQILYSAACYGKQRGLLKLHLGGGRTSVASDSLLKFKKTMGTDSHGFYIGRRIIDLERYTKIRLWWIKENPALLAKYGNRLLCYRYNQKTKSE